MRPVRPCITPAAQLPDCKGPLVSARCHELGRWRQAKHPGAWRNRRLLRPSAVRLDVEPDRSDRCAHRLRPVRQHHHSAVQPESGHVQATECDRRERGQLRVRRHRPELQVPAGVAHQHRSRPPAAGRLTSTAEYIYNKDVNGIYYLNANLPAAQTTFSGVDARPRWTANRINNTSPIITAAYVMKNESVGRSWNISEMLSKTLYHGLTLKGAYSYGMSQNTIDPGSNASGRGSATKSRGIRTTRASGSTMPRRGTACSPRSPTRASHFGFGATTISSFFEAKPSYPNFSTTASYVFAGDMNGDGAAGNDLIYIPRNTSEMNFTAFPGKSDVHGRRTGTGVRGVHQPGQVPERAPGRVRDPRRCVLPRC